MEVNWIKTSAKCPECEHNDIQGGESDRTQPLLLGVPQVVQGLDVLCVVQVIRVLLRGQVEASDADIVGQQQHWRVSCK